MSRERILILGAAGRDFHNFNTAYRRRPEFEVVGFTATQIPNIADRRYPPELSGPHYPEGIPIYPEEQLEGLVKQLRVDRVIMAYSDLSHEQVMHLASRTLAAGADFGLLGPQSTMIKSRVPVIAVCAVRTGCGKSQTSRYVVEILRRRGHHVAVIRHPMPYGDLKRQAVERLASYDDLARFECTIEEREEYEAHIAAGTVVFAGVDYGAILAEAEKEADIIIWDGGNNDLPFYRPDLWITVADPLRPGHEQRFHPGEANFRAADVVVINKVNTAKAAAVDQVAATARALNPQAVVVRAASEVTVAEPEKIRGRRVLLVEDGPTLTHGGMPYGAGQVAAQRYGASVIVDPRPVAVGSIAATYQAYPHMGALLPAMGYFPQQIADLEATINRVDCDTVVVATPIELGRLLKIDRPFVQATYSLVDQGEPTLGQQVEAFLDRALRTTR